MAKHGIDFILAQALWGDEERVILPAKAVKDEVRSALIAKFDAKVWFAVFVEREDRTRIISVRRARPREEVLYAENNHR